MHPKWVSHNRLVEAGFMLASVEVFNPDTSASVYDAETNTWDATKTVVWSGLARVQPKTSNTALNSGMNPTDIGEVYMHLGATGLVDIRPGHQIFVTSCDTNPQLVNFIYTVKSSINSSNAWNRVLLCEVDQEVRRSV